MAPRGCSFYYIHTIQRSHKNKLHNDKFAFIASSAVGLNVVTYLLMRQSISCIVYLEEDFVMDQSVVSKKFCPDCSARRKVIGSRISLCIIFWRPQISKWHFMVGSCRDILLWTKVLHIQVVQPINHHKSSAWWANITINYNIEWQNNLNRGTC